jgi:hypothetical protein
LRANDFADVRNVGLEFDESAKFIFMVRNPIDLAVALHAENRKAGWEGLGKFEDAWRAQDVRRRAPIARNPHSFLYGDVAKLGVQLERAMELIPRENLHVVVYDDFAKNPLNCYKGVLAFLGLDYDGRVEFPVVNAKQTYRAMWFNRFIVSVSDTMGPNAPLQNGLVRAAGFLRRLNVVSRAYEGPSGPFRAELHDYFCEDIALLGRLIGRDLSTWR